MIQAMSCVRLQIDGNLLAGGKSFHHVEKEIIACLLEEGKQFRDYDLNSSYEIIRFYEKGHPIPCPGEHAGQPEQEHQQSSHGGSCPGDAVCVHTFLPLQPAVTASLSKEMLAALHTPSAAFKQSL